MTDQSSPITPPPELVEKWAHLLSSRSDHAVFSLAAQWGADQELEACCEWLSSHCYPGLAQRLRAARRPKPPSLKEQGLESLDEVILCLKMLTPGAPVDGIHIKNIRLALEALPND